MTAQNSAGSVPLSFETFLARQNNFRMHFAAQKGELRMADIYMNREPYRKAAEQPDFVALAEELRQHICKERLLAEDEYKGKLYAAYLYMHPFTQSPDELFI